VFRVIRFFGEPSRSALSLFTSTFRNADQMVQVLIGNQDSRPSKTELWQANDGKDASEKRFLIGTPELSTIQEYVSVAV
jgi:hypothetical protein